MGFLSCGKPETDSEEFKDISEHIEELYNLNKLFEENMHFQNGGRSLYDRASSWGLWKVRLADGTIIGKVKSSDGEYSESAMDEAYLGIDSKDDYDVIIIDTEDDSYKTILRDKYRNIKLLPINHTVNYRKTTETIDDKYIVTLGGKIYTPFFKCFLLQTIKHSNTYKLIYLDNIASGIDNIIQKDYEYESTFTPGDAEITITPNYFIVYHQGHYTVRDADNYYDAGEEYILINKKTGEYKIIDSARAIDIDW
jgi:hypothetical protein